MTVPFEVHQAHELLKKIVFRLEWDDLYGRGDGKRYGTGFFITPEGVALTAFHNLPDEVLRNPELAIRGNFGGEEVEFFWVLPAEEDRKWQQAHDLAVIEIRPPRVDIPILPCYYLHEKLRGEVRQLRWATRKVILMGHPLAKSFGPECVPGIVTSGEPIKDVYFKDRSGASRLYTTDAISIRPDFEGPISAMTGMSGAPVYDPEIGGITGVFFGVDSGAYASELLALARHWGAGRGFLRARNRFRLPSHGQFPVKAFLAVSAALAIAAGAWYVRKPAPISPAPKERMLSRPQAGASQFEPLHLGVKVLRDRMPDGEPLRDTTRFKEGEKVRFAITSGKGGYLYVADQELARDGQASRPYLIFPGKNTSEGSNRVAAGTEFLYPAKDDRQPYVEPRASGTIPDYAGELLIFLVYQSPLALTLSEKPLPLEPEQLLPSLPGSRLFQTVAAEAPVAMEVVRVTVEP